MILLVHLLFGAAIGHVIKNPALGIALALSSHYFLDFFPHVEYPIGNIGKTQWRKAMPEILSVALDFSLGILLVSLLSDNSLIIYSCAFFAILPDGFSVLDPVIKIGALKHHNHFHQVKIHLFKHKKISDSWRILSQAIAVAIAIVLFKI